MEREAPFHSDLDAALYGRKDPLMFNAPQVPVDRDKCIRQAIEAGHIIDRGEDFLAHGFSARYVYAAL